MYGKKTGKRLLSWVLVLIMALSMLPLNVLADEVGGTGRYVALVDFNTNATVADAGWQDVSTEAGYTAILTAINDLKPDGGTNLDDGLQNANLLFAKSNVQEIDSKNIIALTDGEPTYYMTKDIFGSPTVGGFGNSCTKEVFEATANTAASICNSGTTLYSICFGAANEEVKNPNTGAYISLFEYLNTYIALNKTYSANDFSGLKDAFDAISSSITSGLSSGTVHDSLPDGVTCISGDFEGNWNLTGATGEPGEGGVTTYTYTKTYTVKIDPTAVDAEQYNGYYPLNGPTTLTVKGSNDEDVTIDFPIPAGKVTLQKYDLTINYKYADGSGAKPTHTESLTYGSSYSVASHLITGYTFAGWYTEEKLTNKYDFAAPVTGNITRAETMTLVNRVLNRQPKTEDDLLPNMTVWTDNASPKAWYYLAVQEATNSHYYKFKTNSQYEKWSELRETRDWTLLEK